MIRTWAALALLAASWLPGLGYFEPVSWPAWAVMVTAAVLLLAGGWDKAALAAAGPPTAVPAGPSLARGELVPPYGPSRMPTARLGKERRSWRFCLRPGSCPGRTRRCRWRSASDWCWAGRPFRAGGRRALGWGAVQAGLVLLVQSLAMMHYAGFTARWHDLPWPLAWLVGLIASTSGLDAALDQSTVAIYSMPEIHRFAATWELLVDPVSVCFLVGGLVILGLRAVGLKNRGPAGRGRVGPGVGPLAAATDRPAVDPLHAPRAPRRRRDGDEPVFQPLGTPSVGRRPGVVGLVVRPSAGGDGGRTLRGPASNRRPAG